MDNETDRLDRAVMLVTLELLGFINKADHAEECARDVVQLLCIDRTGDPIGQVRGLLRGWVALEDRRRTAAANCYRAWLESARRAA